MNKPVNVMVDLETMGTSANAAIVSIGAVIFDLETSKLDEIFYTVIDLTSSVDAGGIIDSETVKWWLKQNQNARDIFNREEKDILQIGLAKFKLWFPENARLWGNGADFDNVILGSAYKRIGKETPWKYYNNMCYRTIKNLYPEIKLKREGTYHNALDDAISQAKHLCEIYKIIKGL